MIAIPDGELKFVYANGDAVAHVEIGNSSWANGYSHLYPYSVAYFEKKWTYNLISFEQAVFPDNSGSNGLQGCIAIADDMFLSPYLEDLGATMSFLNFPYYDEYGTQKGVLTGVPILNLPTGHTWRLSILLKANVTFAGEANYGQNLILKPFIPNYSLSNNLALYCNNAYWANWQANESLMIQESNNLTTKTRTRSVLYNVTPQMFNFAYGLHIPLCMLVNTRLQTAIPTINSMSYSITNLKRA